MIVRQIRSLPERFGRSLVRSSGMIRLPAIVLATVGVLALLCQATTVRADTHTATSCELSAVQAAISAASAGDTVNVPAGAATWNGMLLVSKGINLIGGNGGTTTIYGGTAGGWILQYDPTNVDADDAFRLSGFTFDGNNQSSLLRLGHVDKRPPFTMQTKVRIDRNVFRNANFSGGYGIWNMCTCYGVVDNNTMTNVGYPIKNDTQSDLTWWSISPENNFAVGSEKYLYYEDNTLSEITYPGGKDGLLVEAQFSGRYAFRYNTITVNAVSYSLFEQHGHQGSGQYGMGSCFGAELYGNRIISNSNGVTLFKTRGGQSLVFNNSVEGTDPGLNAYDGSMVTVPEEQYHPAEQLIHDSYWWGNRRDLAGSLAGAGCDNSYNITYGGRSHIPTLGRDVMSDSSSPAFVSAGTLANRPTNAVVGQGYWATTQSTTNLTGMVGVNPSTPISGTLYKCTTAPNTWTAIYTPYTYPHPLRSGTEKGTVSTGAAAQEP